MAFSTSMTGMGCGVAEAIRWTDWARPTSARYRAVRYSQDSPSTSSRTTVFSATADLHRRFDDQLVDLDQLRGVFNNAGLGVADVALAGQVLERVLDGGPGPVGTVAVDPHLGRQFVGGLEADAPDVVGQLVRVLLDLGDGFLAVGAVDPDRPTGTDAVLGQEEHDLADFLLLLPALADPLDPFLADALDVQEEIGGRLEDLQRPFFVDADDLGGNFGPMLRIAPEARYFSMPSAEAGWVVLSSSALNCWPCSRSTTHLPVASRCSPAETEVVLPTTVTKSWRPLTCTLRTAKPFSGLW